MTSLHDILENYFAEDTIQLPTNPKICSSELFPGTLATDLENYDMNERSNKVQTPATDSSLNGYNPNKRSNKVQSPATDLKSSHNVQTPETDSSLKNYDPDKRSDEVQTPVIDLKKRSREVWTPTTQGGLSSSISNGSEYSSSEEELLQSPGKTPFINDYVNEMKAADMDAIATPEISVQTPEIDSSLENYDPNKRSNEVPTPQIDSSLKKRSWEVWTPATQGGLSPSISNGSEYSSSEEEFLQSPSKAPFINDCVNEMKAADTDAMATPEISRVLIIYTGGTIGMKHKRQFGYVPVPNYLSQTLAQMPRFHDPRISKFELISSFDTPSPFLEPSNRNVPMIKVSKNGHIESRRSLVTPSSLYGKRICYSIIEYEPLLDSCNISNRDWIRIATDIEENYQLFDAFIILHGTDTMAYTASALSFILENLGKTVILTGSQVPISEVRNDAVENLLGALTIAGHFVIPEVCLFFNNKLFRGNRVSKINAVDFDAFDSPNLRPLVTVGINIEVNWAEIVRPSVIAKFKAHKKLNSNVATLRLFPGITESTVRAFLVPPIQGIVLETYGAGNAPDTRADLMEAFREASHRGVVIVNCTQCKKGRVTDIYATGKALGRVGIVPGSDMTPECALAKLSYLLGNDFDPSLVRSEMARNLRGELTIPVTKPRFTLNNKAHNLIQDIINVATAAALATAPMNATGTNTATLSINLQERVLMEKNLYPILLCSAAGTDDIEGLELLCEGIGESLVLNCVDYDGRTPLHIACTSNHYRIAKFLIQRGASVHVKDRFGQTPLYAAARNKHRRIIQLLREAGAHFNDSENDHVICQVSIAASIGDVELLKCFINAGWEVNHTGFDHRTVLHHAVAQGHRAVVEYLLSLPEILLETKDRWAKTPLDDAEINLGRVWEKDLQREVDARAIVKLLREKIEARNVYFNDDESRTPSRYHSRNVSQDRGLGASPSHISTHNHDANNTVASTTRSLKAMSLKENVNGL